MIAFRSIRGIAAVALACVCTLAAAQSDESPALLAGTLEKVRQSGAVTIGYRDSSIPFSYLSARGEPIGYSIDLCRAVVDALADAVGKPVAIRWLPVTAESRIAAVTSGRADLECGSTTNNIERQQQVSFVVTTFVTANRFVSKKSAGLSKLEDLKGKTLVSTSGTSNLKEVTEINGAKKLGINVVPAAEHPAAFAMVETDRAAAFAMDDILLYGLVANAKTPGNYVISSEAISIQPYAIMLRKGDAPFKKVADNAVIATFKSGEINKIYAKWFLAPIPPKNINLNVPMSDQLKKVIASPTDSGDQAAYK